MNELKKLKVIEAAQAIFLRYGVKRSTMADIAEAVGISRPSLYLIYPNKDEIFKDIIQHTVNQSLVDIRNGLSHISKPIEQLAFAFEIWTVKPYALINSAADAKELTLYAHQFCKEIYIEGGKQFENIIQAVIQPHLKSDFAAVKMARMIRASIRGFKEMVEDVKTLREMIDDFLNFIAVTAFKTTVDCK